MADQDQQPADPARVLFDTKEERSVKHDCGGWDDTPRPIRGITHTGAGSSRSKAPYLPAWSNGGMTARPQRGGAVPLRRAALFGWSAGPTGAQRVSWAGRV